MTLTAMPKYDTYKDSGVDWLGEIPFNWNITPGLVAFSENKRSNKGMKEDVVLSLSYGKIIVKPVEKLVGLVPESFETYQIVEPHDIIIRCTDLQNDQTSLRIGLAKHHGIITSAYLNLKVSDAYSARYLYYYLYALDTTKVIYRFGSGLRQNLSFIDFKRLPVFDIPRDTQTAIADFIDEKTAKIDEAIAIKEQQIALLNERKQILIQQAVTQGLDLNVSMKDSGIIGLGKIPSHWSVCFNRHLFRENSRSVIGNELALSLSQIDGVIPSSEMTERALSPAHRKNFKLVFPGDLVVNRFKGHLGVFFESAYSGIISFHYGVFTAKHGVYSKFYEFLYHTDPYKVIYAGASNGMTIGLQNLSNQNFYMIKSPLPPYDEQIEICKFVQGVADSTLKLVHQISSQILMLKEYKTTLINSAVTGKIKVA